MQTDRSHKPHGKPTRKFEPDQIPVKTLFVVVVGLTIGVVVVVLTLSQFFRATSEAEVQAKAGTPLAQLVDLRKAERAELTGYGRVGCPETPAPVGADQAVKPGEGSDAAAEECEPHEAIYHMPVAKAREDVLADATLLQSIPLPAVGPAPAKAAGLPGRRPGAQPAQAPGRRTLQFKNPALLRKKIQPGMRGAKVPPMAPGFADKNKSLPKSKSP